jgi:hypothetical protein
MKSFAKYLYVTLIFVLISACSAERRYQLFKKKYPQFFEGVDTTLTFIDKGIEIDTIIFDNSVYYRDSTFIIDTITIYEDSVVLVKTFRTIWNYKDSFRIKDSLVFRIDEKSDTTEVSVKKTIVNEPKRKRSLKELLQIGVSLIVMILLIILSLYLRKLWK